MQIVVTPSQRLYRKNRLRRISVQMGPRGKSKHQKNQNNLFSVPFSFSYFYFFSFLLLSFFNYFVHILYTNVYKNKFQINSINKEPADNHSCHQTPTNGSNHSNK